MVIFGAGVVTGGLLVRRTAFINPQPGQRVTAWSRTNVLATPGGMRVEFLRRIQRDLDLRLDQREAFDRILKESQDRTRKLMEPINPQLRDEMQRTREEVRALLTPEQRKRFDELLKHQQRAREPRTPPRERSTEGGPNRPPAGESL